jgi:hypothetical protein
VSVTNEHSRKVGNQKEKLEDLCWSLKQIDFTNDIMASYLDVLFYPFSVSVLDSKFCCQELLNRVVALERTCK